MANVCHALDLFIGTAVIHPEFVVQIDLPKTVNITKN